MAAPGVLINSSAEPLLVYGYICNTLDAVQFGQVIYEFSPCLWTDVYTSNVRWGYYVASSAGIGGWICLGRGSPMDADIFSPVVLPGSICEQCFDAPAMLLRSSPWGGEMGVCKECAQQRVEAAEPIAG